MSFIDRPMDDVEEPKYGPEGLYGLVVKSATDQMDGAHRKGMLLICEITKAPAGVDISTLANVMHNISFPLPTDDETKAKNKILFLKRAAAVFGVDVKGKAAKDITPNDFVGKRTASVALKVKNYEGKFSNVINLPALPQTKK